MSEGLAQSSYVAAREGFEPATHWTQGTEITTEQPRPTIFSRGIFSGLSGLIGARGHECALCIQQEHERLEIQLEKGGESRDTLQKSGRGCEELLAA